MIDPVFIINKTVHDGIYSIKLNNHHGFFNTNAAKFYSEKDMHHFFETIYSTYNDFKINGTPVYIEIMDIDYAANMEGIVIIMDDKEITLSSIKNYEKFVVDQLLGYIKQAVKCGNSTAIVLCTNPGKFNNIKVPNIVFNNGTKHIKNLLFSPLMIKNHPILKLQYRVEKLEVEGLILFKDYEIDINNNADLVSKFYQGLYAIVH